MLRTLSLVLVLISQVAVNAYAKNMYIPIAGTRAGGFGTFWRTDLRIYNPSTVEAIDVTLHFLPQGMDGTNISGQLFHIEKRGTLVLDNVAATLMPTLQDPLGAIRIDSDTDRSYAFVASSRTYTDSNDVQRPGTKGQFVRALDPDEATHNSVILHVKNRPEFRTNIGVMNPGSNPATVKVKIVGVNGIVYLESAPRVVQPKSMEQWALTDLFDIVYMADGAAVVESTVPVFTWGSVTDNFSGDAIFVEGAEDVATVTPLENQR